MTKQNLSSGGTVAQKESGDYPPGTRVSARYRGDGTVVAPDEAMMQMPHFEDDLAVRWDEGGASWHGAVVLRRLPGVQQCS